MTKTTSPVPPESANSTQAGEQGVQFTPGPWFVDYIPHARGQRREVRSAAPKFELVGKNPVVASVPCYRGTETAEADATLISAAPDMYEALKMITPVWARVLADRHGGTPEEQREPVLNFMRLVLSKARGGQR